MSTPWRVYIRDPQLQRIALLEDYTSLDMALKFNDISPWQLTLSARSNWASTLTQDGYGIQVYRGGTYMLGGSWSKFRYQWDKDTDEVSFSGEDDTAWFKHRLASPAPTTADQSGTWTGPAEDVSPSGAASSVIAYIAQRNLGTDAWPGRKVAASTSSVTYGQTMVQRARWQNLLTFCQEIATAGAVNGIEPGFRIVQTGTTLQLQTYQPTDRTSTIKLSPALKNVRSLTYERSAPEATTVYVGGVGEGAARTYFVKTSSEATVWGRREADLANASSLSALSELTTEADKVLAEKGLKQSLSVVPRDLPNMEFGVDYQVGDKVTAILNQLGPGGGLKPGDVVEDVLREARINLTAGGAEVTATVGSNAVGYNLIKLFDRMRSFATRLTDVERT